MDYTAGDIAAITGCTILGNAQERVQRIEYDTRIIYSAEGKAFVNLAKPLTQQIKNAEEAIDKGIRVVITPRETVAHILAKCPGATCIVSQDPLATLHRLAKHHRERFPALQVIGITGSNGKTIVKEWLSQCLTPAFRVVKSPKSYNSQLGLALSLLQIRPGDEIGIFEVGISAPSEMQVAAALLQPDIGVFTHFGTAHSANFPSAQAHLGEKLSLFEKCSSIIYPGDEEPVRLEIEKKFVNKNLLSFGENRENDISYASSDDHLYTFTLPEGSFTIPVERDDPATLSNAACVISTLHLLQLPNEVIEQKINALKAVEMRMEQIRALGGNLIINDSYTFDFDSLNIALQGVKSLGNKDVVLVMSEMPEQHLTAEHHYKKLAHIINDFGFNKIYLIGNQYKEYFSLFNCSTEVYPDTASFLKAYPTPPTENSIILLKGARSFTFEKISKKWQDQKHDTVLEINLSSISHNIRQHQKFLSPECKMMCMVKAHSYGMGSYQIAQHLQQQKLADYLGVAYVDEGIELRKHGITLPIIVMNPEVSSYDALIDYQLEPEIYSFRVLELFRNILADKDVTEPYPIHIKLDTGMHRLGFVEEDIDQLGNILYQAGDVTVSSIFSHLAASDDAAERDFTHQQAATFTTITESLAKHLGYMPMRHLLNSAGIVHFPQYQYEMVRIGIGMAGLSADARLESLLEPVAVFKSVISQIHVIRKGETVGYNRRFRAAYDMRIGTVPVGYADGIPRCASPGGAQLLVNGQPVPIVGTVCMDMLMVSLENVAANEGDEVFIFHDVASLKTFSAACGTITYETLSSISPRVKRIYIKN